ncbi:unnamed protein product [Durusdinium trenchii]|uniref:Methyltransferase type 11 domain-containing protein n=1 Tax=Durusdinium trenchii TaxID=1381693 RepID=A0ABP0LMC2_9DINO
MRCMLAGPLVGFACFVLVLEMRRLREAACFAMPRPSQPGRSTFGDAAWRGLNMNLGTDHLFRRTSLEQKVIRATSDPNHARGVYDSIMVAALGREAYQRILEGIDPPRLVEARQEMMSFLPNGRVLEVGCGIGELASNLPLYPAGTSLIGLDPSVTPSGFWPSPPGVHFRAVKGMAEDLPFPAGHFDAVVGDCAGAEATGAIRLPGAFTCPFRKCAPLATGGAGAIAPSLLWRL